VTAVPPDTRDGMSGGAGARDRIGRAIIMREQITLACAECKRRNYSTMKNKRNTTDRVELSKYCPWCRKHTPHRETK